MNGGVETFLVNDIHLIRDFNHDILGHPWDEEFKTLASDFGKLLHKIIRTVDQYGLRELVFSSSSVPRRKISTHFVKMFAGRERYLLSNYALKGSLFLDESVNRIGISMNRHGGSFKQLTCTFFDIGMIFKTSISCVELPLGSAATKLLDDEVYTPCLLITIPLILDCFQAGFTMNNPVLSVTCWQKVEFVNQKRFPICQKVSPPTQTAVNVDEEIDGECICHFRVNRKYPNRLPTAA